MAYRRSPDSAEAGTGEGLAQGQHSVTSRWRAERVCGPTVFRLPINPERVFVLSIPAPRVAACFLPSLHTEYFLFLLGPSHSTLASRGTCTHSREVSWSRAPARPALERAYTQWESTRKKERKKTEEQTSDRGGGQGPHLHEQDFGRTIRGTGGALLLLTGPPDKGATSRFFASFFRLQKSPQHPHPTPPPPPTYLLRGPLGRSKADLPTYCIGASQCTDPLSG